MQNSTVRYGFVVAILGLCGLMAGEARADFVGPYQLQNWTAAVVSNESGGSPSDSITPSSGPSSTAAFGYDLNLGNPGPGVLPIAWSFTTTAAASGTVSFDYDFSGFNGYYATDANLSTIVGAGGSSLVSANPYGDYDYTGSASFYVTQGETFGILVEGDNYDYISQVSGTVTLTNFSVSSVPEPSSLTLFCGLSVLIASGVGLRRRLTTR